MIYEIIIPFGIVLGLLFYYRTCRCCDKMGMSFFHLKRGKLRYDKDGNCKAFYCDDCLKNNNEFMNNNARGKEGLIWT